MIKSIRKVKLDARGFTLIEMIASLVLLGIMAVMAGLGIVQITKQYVFTQKAGETAQVAQVAMARMVKELTLVRSATSTGSGSIVFDTPTLSGRSISWAGVNSPILMNGERLIDNIQSFTLSYHNTYSTYDGGAFPGSFSPTSTVMIGISFKDTGADGISSTFTDRAFVRN
jgi:prepilin-type N-terminal cleavage/methylation domain-containing protein